MASATWQDPRGAQRAYQTPWSGSTLRSGTARALEREKVWGQVDPSFQGDQFDLSESGKITKQEGFPWGYAAMAAGAPLAGMFLPAMFASGGAAGSAGAAEGAAAGAGGAGAASAAGGGLAG